MVHEAYPQSRPRPVVIIVSAHVVRSYVRLHFSQNKFQAKTMFATGETVGLAEWIIDDTCLVSISSFRDKILNLVPEVRSSEKQKCTAKLSLYNEYHAWKNDNLWLRPGGSSKIRLTQLCFTALEFVSIEKRSMIGTLSFAIGFTFGGSYIAWLIKYLGEWKLLHHILYAQMGIIFITPL